MIFTFSTALPSMQELRIGLKSLYMKRFFQLIINTWMIRILSRLYKKRKIYKNLIFQIKTFPVKRFLFDVYIEQIRSKLNDRGIKDEEEILYHFTYIQSGIIICISNWLNQGCKESPQYLSRILYDCITQKEYKT